LKIILLTRIKPAAGIILKSLAEKNISVSAVYIERRNAGGILQRIKKIYKKQGLLLLLKELSNALWSKIHISQRANLTSLSYYRNFCSKLFFFEDFNGADCINMLSRAEPDIVILAGTRIIHDGVLKTAKMCFLNSHPALLPYYRGVDVIPACILNGDKPHVTIHKVDAGVDTGKILETREIPLEPGDTIDSLRQKAVDLAGVLMSEVVYKLVNNIPVAERENKKELGKQYYMMSAKQLKEAEKKLRKITGAA
jgi:methionyl-tRNA formyltransferase